jgi:hypothetical protein
MEMISIDCYYYTSFRIIFLAQAILYYSMVARKERKQEKALNAQDAILLFGALFRRHDIYYNTKSKVDTHIAQPGTGTRQRIFKIRTL